MSIQKPQKKLYYSLRQTAEMLGLSTPVIKSWEDDFYQLKPVRNRAGNRMYTEKDLALLFLIKELLLEKKLSIPEIQQRLRNHRAEIDNNETMELKLALAEVKLEIQEIIELLTE